MRCVVSSVRWMSQTLNNEVAERCLFDCSEVREDKFDDAFQKSGHSS